VLTPQFEEALVYATRLHAAQVRKGSNIPYISHLMAVSALTLEYGGGEVEAIAGLLHDAVEDQGGRPTLAVIEDRFGPAVAEIVLACSDSETIPKPPWRARKEQYIAHLRTAPFSVRLVSGCDKLHNARTLLQDYRIVGEDLWSRFTGAREGTLWYYRALIEAYSTEGIEPLIAELTRVVNELESLAASA
jgi:(p)ppGpp synthase/HD superfamily hydrolase